MASPRADRMNLRRAHRAERDWLSRQGYWQRTRRSSNRASTVNEARYLTAFVTGRLINFTAVVSMPSEDPFAGVRVLPLSELIDTFAARDWVAWV